MVAVGTAGDAGTRLIQRELSSALPHWERQLKRARIIRPATAANDAEWHAVVAVIEQIHLPLPRTRIPYEDEVDIAILAWIASHVRGVRQPTGAQATLTFGTGRPLDLPKCRKGSPL